MLDSERVQRLLKFISDNKGSSSDELLELCESQALEEDVIELGKLDWSPRKNWVEESGGDYE